MASFLDSIGYNSWVLPALLLIPLIGAVIVLLLPVRHPVGTGVETPAARQLLRVVCADQLAALANTKTEIWIVGHADRVGTSARNLELSQLRAKNVRQALLDVLGPALKVPVGNVHDIGFSEWLAALKLHPNDVKNPDDRRVDLLINGSLVATFRES